MRKLLFISLLVVAASCKREPLTMYDAEDSIYFNYQIDQYSLSDSMNISFAYSPAGVKDTLLAVPVAATGTFSDKERQISLTIDPSSTAEQGKHYELPPAVFHAGKVTDTLFVRLKRSADLTTGTKKLVLRLQPNESFKTDIKYKLALTAARDTLDMVSFTISLSDMLSEGPYWSVYKVYFDNFSLKKVRFINELVGMPLDFWLDPSPNTYRRAMAVYYAATTSRYLSEQAALGNIIRDEDGTPMKMGAAYR